MDSVKEVLVVFIVQTVTASGVNLFEYPDKKNLRNRSSSS